MGSYREQNRKSDVGLRDVRNREMQVIQYRDAFGNFAVEVYFNPHHSNWYKLFFHCTLAQVINSDYKINGQRYEVTYTVSEYIATQRNHKQNYISNHQLMQTIIY